MEENYVKLTREMIGIIRKHIDLNYEFDKDFALKLEIKPPTLTEWLSGKIGKIRLSNYKKIKIEIPDFPKPVSIISQPQSMEPPSIPEHGYVINVLKEKYHLTMNSEEKKEIISKIAKSDLADSLKVKVINIINDL